MRSLHGRKQNKVFFNSNLLHRKSSLLELIYSDVYGHLKIQPLGDLTLCLSLMTISKKHWVYAIKTNDQVLDKLKAIRASDERQIGEKVKCIWTDNGGVEVQTDDQIWKAPETGGSDSRLGSLLTARLK